MFSLVRTPRDEKQASLEATWNETRSFSPEAEEGERKPSRHICVRAACQEQCVFLLLPLLWSRVRLLLVSGQSLDLRILIYSFFLEEVSERERDSGENWGFLQSVNLKNVFFL